MHVCDQNFWEVSKIVMYAHIQKNITVEVIIIIENSVLLGILVYWNYRSSVIIYTKQKPCDAKCVNIREFNLINSVIELVVFVNVDLSYKIVKQFYNLWPILNYF